MSPNLELHKTWNILDSTKIQEYKSCPRKFFYHFVLGWQPVDTSVHLVFGEAWHRAMESLLLFGYSEESVELAYLKLLQYYRQHFNETQDEFYYPKTPGFAREMLKKYVKKYPRDLQDFEVLYTEISGSVPVSDDRVVYFKTDSLCRYLSGSKEGRYFSLEHKTAKTLKGPWGPSWTLKTQVGVYTHVLYCLYGNSTYGVIVNGAQFQKTDPNFQRIELPKKFHEMELWLEELNLDIDEIYRDYDRLSDSSDSSPRLLAFRRNTESCVKYGLCEYHGFCTSWLNPLQNLDRLPATFEIRFWNPTELETTNKMDIR